ncbi:excinuclease ABC subunit UvrA [Paenibacillus elgii]
MGGAIVIQGAYENNLKHVSLSIPKNKLVVLTGLSGSGKSTLAMDILQKECQRQYMESMGIVTDAIDKPKVESITGLSPSIGVGQQIANRNPRSTLGTITEIYTYLRVLYARLGERPCPSCGATIRPSFEPAGEEADHGTRLLEESHGSEMDRCPQCRCAVPKLKMAHFSFNKPEGACEACAGMGVVTSLETGLVFDEERSFRDGCVTFWDGMFIDYYSDVLQTAAKHYGFTFDPDAPMKDYSPVQRDLLLHGVESEPFAGRFPGIKPPKSVGKGRFEGALTYLNRRHREQTGDTAQSRKLASYFTRRPCPACEGTRLRSESRLVTISGQSISEISSWPLHRLMTWLEEMRPALSEAGQQVLDPIIHDIAERMRRVAKVGLGYLSLDRQANTLSGGESQRLRLASLLGSGLTGVLYVLDEPTAGLHPRDTASLIGVLQQLRDLGNTVLVIEHDVDVMEAADYIIDMGPGAGRQGGVVVGTGTLEALMSNPGSVTGQFLKNVHGRTLSSGRRPGNGAFLTVRDAYTRNLKNITVELPLGTLIAVTGVSGSGKSTLLFDLIDPAGRQYVQGRTESGLECGSIDGFEHIDKWITVDQSPIGRIQRSNIATYTDVFTLIRNLFSGLPEAKRRKLSSKHFSFNVPGGRCEKCQGLGVLLLDMHFLPDVEAVCPDCGGRRFKDDILSVTYKGKNISELLDMTVQESLHFFSGHRELAEKLALLCEVGLGYLQLGQSATTLSGGEAQRLKLAKELSKKAKGHTLYLLDEPTTGLHPSDVRQLLILLNKLVDAGNTVIVIEHHLDLIREADWIVDLGPDGGEAGGYLVAQGTPEHVAQADGSYTAAFLRNALNG